MYVCNCNGLSEQAVRGAVETGARTAGEVYRALGARPRCARCVPEVVGMLRSTGIDDDAPVRPLLALSRVTLASFA